MKVLIFTATYGAGPQAKTVASIKAQRFAGEWVYEESYHNPFGEGDPRNTTAQMERGREMALAGDYDAMLSVEHDMLIPPDALQRLWDAETPVAYGVYVFRHGVPVLNAYEKYPGGSRNVGESLSLHPHKLRELMGQDIIEVSGVGFGCTLIRRDVLAKIPFHLREGDVSGSDLVFATDCLRAGIRQVARFSVPCGHWNGEKWLMPNEDNRVGLMKVKALKNVVARVGSDSQRLTEGQEYELPSEDAVPLMRAGYVMQVGTSRKGAKMQRKP